MEAADGVSTPINQTTNWTNCSRVE